MKRLLLPLAAVALLAAGCIKVDNSLGKGLVDKSHIYDTYTVEFPLTEITMKKSSDLSGFSSTRIVAGAVRDDEFGLTTRESAFTLVPFLDTLDLGTNPKAVSFDIYFAGDTVSCADDSQARIMQNIFVTALTEKPNSAKSSTATALAHGSDVITDGLPVYNGSGPLAFSLTKSFAQQYLDAIKTLAPDGILVNREWDEDTIKERFEKYTDALPGIHIATDIPSGNGGRINLFDLSCLSVSNSQFYFNNNYGLLQYTNDENPDADNPQTIVFIPGEMSFLDEETPMNSGTRFTQYAFNHTTHESTEGKATSKIMVEGGGGLKPVISAKELREKTISAIIGKGGLPENTVITKASVILPFEMTADYKDMKYFPSVLSPTVRLTAKDSDGNTSIQFAGLTDASVSTENQGDIDRSNLVYSPDISYHLQEVLTREDLDTATDADIWLLTIFTEQVATATDNSMNEYYQQMAYAMYYNNIYGGGYGYGGYGSYGGYGYNSYSNYYTYAMLAAMMSQSSQQQYTTNTELDKDRYYKGTLCGPESSRPPLFRVSFAISKD